jgi:hypothetical protein
MMKRAQVRHRKSGTSLIQRTTSLSEKWLGFVIFLSIFPKNVLRTIRYARVRKQAAVLLPDYSAGGGLIMFDTELDDILEEYC